MERERFDPFLPAARRLCALWKPEKKKGKLKEELDALGAGRKNCVRVYYEKKVSRALALVLLVLLLLVILWIWQGRENRQVNGGLLERPGYGGRREQLSLNLMVAGEAQSEALEVSLNPRAYTPAQARALLKRAEAEFLEKLPGENESTDEVRNAVVLPATLQDGAVSAEYYITPSGVIEEDGSIPDSALLGRQSQEGLMVQLQALFTCQGKVRTVDLSIRVFPPLYTEQEKLRAQIYSAVQRAETEHPEEGQLHLPEEVNGRRLLWSYPSSPALRMGILLLLLPVFYWAHADSRVHDAAKARQAQLELDYSEVLWKLTMLLSAGLTIRGAFSRIGAQYRAQEGGTRYVYEEMLLALREMKSGVPEASAYENFGRRCAHPAYIKLGSLLAQNLKKGSKGLTAMLEQEAVRSMEQHRLAAKKLGERAAVRMLLPMILMFGVVLIILMVPAFLSF